MLNIVTIATTGFLPYTRRLLRSLRLSGTEFRLTVYCDDQDTFECLSDSQDCKVTELPQIRALGVKRAKFHAYRDAIRSGAFLYLDSDILILEPLTGFEHITSIAGCPDDLSACPFIPDKRHPWPGDPNLENRIYINSGVLYFPSSAASFVERLCVNAMRDELWNRYVIPGGLYDNHFLCAFLNLDEQPVHLLDETEYNWQGFLKDGHLEVERRDDSLHNLRSGKKLRIVHFAGVRDIDALLCSLPVDVASLLCARASQPCSPDEGLTRLLSSVSDAFRDPLPDVFPIKVFDHLLAEVREMARSRFRHHYSGEASYFRAREAMLSLVFSTPNSTILWNDLICGGACLEGEEYNYLARLVDVCGIRSVVETGAGETSILFRRLNIQSVSIEPQPGPWLERARQHGCRCFHIPFNQEKLLFAATELEGALDSINDLQIDLLFIDSPGGTASRSRILGQMLQYVRPRYVLIHDAHRDAPNLFRYTLEHRLTVADYLPTARGMALLSTERGEGAVVAVPRRAPDAISDSPNARLSVLAAPESVAAGETFRVRVQIVNDSGVSLSSHYNHPVLASYHWFDERGECVIYDGIRTALPFDIDPGHSATFEVNVVAPGSELARECELQICLVQELVHWFPEAATARVSVSPARLDC